MRGLFGKFRKTKKLISKENEYELYAQVSDQIQQGQKETGAWAKAFADAKGDEQKTEAIYIELMVERLVLAKQAEMEFASNLEQLNHKRTYKDGEKDGPWVSYNADGTVRHDLTGTFKDGVKVE